MNEYESEFLNFAHKLNSELTSWANRDHFNGYKRSRHLTRHILNNVIPNMLEEEFNNVKFEKYSKDHDQSLEYYQKEIRTVDLISWKSFSPKMPTEQEKHLWKFNILVESENNGETWLQEMQKLSTMIAPYKLIITYGRTLKENDNEETASNKKGVNLLYLADKILSEIDNKNPEEFIVMFGEELVNINQHVSISNLYDIYYYSNKEPITGGKLVRVKPNRSE